jgi:hypothetical protein
MVDHTLHDAVEYVIFLNSTLVLKIINNKATVSSVHFQRFIQVYLGHSIYEICIGKYVLKQFILLIPYFFTLFNLVCLICAAVYCMRKYFHSTNCFIKIVTTTTKLASEGIYLLIDWKKRAIKHATIELTVFHVEYYTIKDSFFKCILCIFTRFIQL